jgi:hypothetical protein
MMNHSGHSMDSEDLDQFYDAATFSFGSSFGSAGSGTGVEAVATTASSSALGRSSGVRFDPVVSILGGCDIPLANGDGYWDTLQYEHAPIARGLQTQDSAMSLSVGEIMGETTIGRARGNQSYFREDSLSSHGIPEDEMQEVEFTSGVHPDDKVSQRNGNDIHVGAIRNFVLKRINDTDERDNREEFAVARTNATVQQESSRLAAARVNNIVQQEPSLRVAGVALSPRDASAAAQRAANRALK